MKNIYSTYWILSSRLILFAFFQFIIFLVFRISGSADSWHISEGWWTFSVLFTNIVSIVILVFTFRKEGRNYFKLFQISKEKLGKDLLTAILLFVIAIPIAFLPNIWLSKLLWGSADFATPMLFRHLPLWAGIISILFPLTQACAELPTYFGLVMPRLAKHYKNGWTAWLIASLFLALQHITLPLIFDWKFILWRFCMFLPFALFIGLCIKYRPKLLAYFMIIHAIMDMGTVIMILNL